MLDWLGKNLRIFLLAFVLAVAVWVSAVTAADPDDTRPYPTPVPIEIIGQDPGLVITNTYTRQIEVVLQAPQSVWAQLTSGTNSVRAVVDISNLSIGSHQVPIQVQVAIHPARIMSTSLETLELVLEKLLTQTRPVEINLIGIPAIGYEVQELQLSSDEVIISGPESVVQRVKKIGASLDVSGVRLDVASELDLQALDENNLPVTGISLSPAKIQVTVPVVQKGGYRDLAVKVVVSGRVANGYRLTSILVNPPVVTVFSTDIDLIDSLPGFVETSQLDLTGLGADFETHLTLNLPDGVTLIGDQKVLAQVGISAIEGSLTITGLPVTVNGLSAGLIASVSPLDVDLYLSGPLPVLDTLLITEVLVSVDATGLVAGTYQLTPIITITLAGVRVETIQPGTVEVIITKGTATPKP
jgi:YbbR domain-containing protein